MSEEVVSTLIGWRKGDATRHDTTRLDRCLPLALALGCRRHSANVACGSSYLGWANTRYDWRASADRLGMKRRSVPSAVQEGRVKKKWSERQQGLLFGSCIARDQSGRPEASSFRHPAGFVNREERSFSSSKVVGTTRTIVDVVSNSKGDKRDVMK